MGRAVDLLRFHRKLTVLLLADRARDARQWELAARLYREALDRNPQNSPIWVQYGHALKESGELRDPRKLAQAEIAYRTALSLDPSAADTYLQLGHILKLQGKEEDAKAAYLRAFALDPSVIFALDELRGLGWSAVETAELAAVAGNHEDATRDLSDSASSIADLPPQGPTALAVPRSEPNNDTVPQVSLLIPVHNRVELTQACLNSIFAHADPDIAVEIIIIDDCSTDGTASYLNSLGDRIRVLCNETRGCFGHNLNKAAAVARSDYLVLLNNDTEVTPSWLRRMLDAVRADPTIGVVGNRQLYPDTGNINHAGVVFDEKNRPVHLYPGKPADFPPANISRDFQTLTGACLLVPRAVFRELGGFDPEFRNGHEDTDFCLRARQRGYRVRYVADSVIYHHIGSSPGRYDSEGENERHFTANWGGKIVSDLHDYVTRDAAWLPARVAGPAILTDSADLHLAVPLQFGNAFSWVITRLALACEEAGLRVSLLEGAIDASVDAAAQPRLRRMMERAASKRAQIKWAHYWSPYAERELEGQIRAEIFCTNYRYGPQPLHQLDQWMRHTVVNANRKLPVSRYCLEALTELGVPEDRCRVVPHGYSPEILHDIGADDRYRRHGFVFLAVTNSYDPYRYGTDTLLAAFTRAFAGRKDVVLVLKDLGGQEQGLVANWVRQQPQWPKVVHLCEFFSKEALIALYRGADAFVAPFRGEGFAMKVVDAAAMGLPILAPHYGGPADYLKPDEFFPLAFREVPVGECLDRHDGIVPAFARWAEVEVNALVEQMQGVLGQIGAARQRAEQARTRVLAEFSWRRVASTLIGALGDFERECEATISARHFSTDSNTSISVVIPTLNRPAELTKTLEAYEKQTLAKDKWEVVLSDDGSSYDVADHVAPFAERLRLQVITSSKQTGAGAARNRAIPQARGELILFAGDDIIPRNDFLSAHLAAHRRHNDPRIAVLGYTGWHPDLHVSRLMDYITGDGAQQFGYDRIQPGAFVPINFFYTSNVSLPRALLERQEELFSGKFTGAGFEDIELGLRLEQDGMQILYAPEAEATHLHPMSDESIVRRQYNIGRWLVTYAMLHPQRLGERHRMILRWLETYQHVLRQQPTFVTVVEEIAAAAASTASWLDGAARATTALEHIGKALNLQSGPSAHLVRREAAQLPHVQKRIFALRLDMAECDGIADEWLGVAAGVPNPARDLVRAIFCRADLEPAAAPAPAELAAIGECNAVGERASAPSPAPIADFSALRGLEPRGRIAVVLHLFYPELWEEMREAIARISEPFDLFVSLVKGFSDHMRPLISKSFHHAYVVDYENRGRDIGPFMALVQSGALFQYELICKVHAKRSDHREDGDAWRRALIDGVLGSSPRVQQIVARFRADADLGIVVAEGNVYDGPDRWAGTEQKLAALLPRLGISPEVEHRSFPGGSIFWIRPFLLRTVASLNLASEDFEPEPAPIDGTLFHAIERIFGLVCEHAGMRVMEHGQLTREVPEPAVEDADVKVIAHYLPQFHPVPENDAWWGTGFTEWTNVTRARPLFENHNQPRLPTELGFYDLRLPETREAQAALARRYGVSGFCYYYYWFNGRRVLDRPLNEVLASGLPDFPFMICWANEPWSRNWDGLNDDVLLPQTYEPGWTTRFAGDVAPLMRDRRYIRITGKPMLFIYRIGHLPNCMTAIRELREGLAAAGIAEVHLAAAGLNFPGDAELPQNPSDLGLDAYFEFPPHRTSRRPPRPLPPGLSENMDALFDYDHVVSASLAGLTATAEGTHHRGVMAGWDNTPRMGERANIFHGATPANFRRWLRGTIAHEQRQGGERFVLINAWNEWAEGTYLEPDREFGRGWLEAVASALGLP
jgi:lipopolysaccharide biosynthesis protein/GT2 family glycosyltransferase